MGRLSPRTSSSSSNTKEVGNSRGTYPFHFTRCYCSSVVDCYCLSTRVVYSLLLLSPQSGVRPDSTQDGLTVGSVVSLSPSRELIVMPRHYVIPPSSGH